MLTTFVIFLSWINWNSALLPLLSFSVTFFFKEILLIYKKNSCKVLPFLIRTVNISNCLSPHFFFLYSILFSCVSSFSSWILFLVVQYALTIFSLSILLNLWHHLHELKGVAHWGYLFIKNSFGWNPFIGIITNTCFPFHSQFTCNKLFVIVSLFFFSSYFVFLSSKLYS